MCLLVLVTGPKLPRESYRMGTSGIFGGFHQLAGHLGDKTPTSVFCKEHCHLTNESYRGLTDDEGNNIGNSEAAE